MIDIQHSIEGAINRLAFEQVSIYKNRKFVEEACQGHEWWKKRLLSDDKDFSYRFWHDGEELREITRLTDVIWVESYLMKAM